MLQAERLSGGNRRIMPRIPIRHHERRHIRQVVLMHRDSGVVCQWNRKPFICLGRTCHHSMGYGSSQSPPPPPLSSYKRRFPIRRRITSGDKALHRPEWLGERLPCGHSLISTNVTAYQPQGNYLNQKPLAQGDIEANTLQGRRQKSNSSATNGFE